MYIFYDDISIKPTSSWYVYEHHIKFAINGYDNPCVLKENVKKIKNKLTPHL